MAAREGAGDLSLRAVAAEAGYAPASVYEYFRNRAELESEMPSTQRALGQDGMLWISWPKRASGIATDLNENSIRDFALANGLVDVKVCAVDDTWSGLKLVYRLRDRQKK